MATMSDYVVIAAEMESAAGFDAAFTVLANALKNDIDYAAAEADIADAVTDLTDLWTNLTASREIIVAALKKQPPSGPSTGGPKPY